MSVPSRVFRNESFNVALYTGSSAKTGHAHRHAPGRDHREGSRLTTVGRRRRTCAIRLRVEQQVLE